MKMFRNIIFFLILIFNLFPLNAQYSAFEEGLKLFPQINYSSNHILFEKCQQIDSLSEWAYFYTPSNKKQTTFKPIGYITFYRKKSIYDSTYPKSWKEDVRIRPEIRYAIHLKHDNDSLKKLFYNLMIQCNCSYPSSGPNMTITKDFIFFSSTMCVPCRLWQSNIDLCRGNIENILHYVRNKHYAKIEDLLSDLPIDMIKPKD